MTKFWFNLETLQAHEVEVWPDASDGMVLYVRVTDVGRPPGPSRRVPQVILHDTAEAAVAANKRAIANRIAIADLEIVKLEQEKERCRLLLRLETHCSVCGAPQIDTPSGPSCRNGHGGAPAKESP